MKALLAGLLCAAACAGAATAALGGPFDSAYTDIDFDQCTMLSSDDLGATYACPGYKGVPVQIAEGDLRMLVSFGADAAEEPAAQQTLPPFNHLGGKIEWRLEKRNGAWVPRATIVRWFTAGDGGVDKGQVLVVTQLKPGATCHIAYIDALAVKDANVVARQIADTKAGSFDCAQEPERSVPFTAY